MIQWVTVYTRYREDKTSRLDLLIIYQRNKSGNSGNSDYVVLEIKIKGGMENKQEELYENIRKNYSKYTDMKKFFNETDWTKI